MEIVQPAIDYLALARSMGVGGVRIDKAADIAPAIEAGIASRAPNVIEVIISPT
jgi:benzoylformate decarboxylase